MLTRGRFLCQVIISGEIQKIPNYRFSFVENTTSISGTYALECAFVTASTRLHKDVRLLSCSGSKSIVLFCRISKSYLGTETNWIKRTIKKHHTNNLKSASPYGTFDANDCAIKFTHTHCKTNVAPSSIHYVLSVHIRWLWIQYCFRRMHEYIWNVLSLCCEWRVWRLLWITIS